MNNYKKYTDPDKGITVVSEETAKQYLPLIGDVKNFLCLPTHGGWKVSIRGTAGEIECYGFSWGYGGEGPSGLWRTLVLAKFHEKMGVSEEYLLSRVRELPQDCTIMFDFENNAIKTLNFVRGTFEVM